MEKPVVTTSASSPPSVPPYLRRILLAHSPTMVLLLLLFLGQPVCTLAWVAVVGRLCAPFVELQRIDLQTGVAVPTLVVLVTALLLIMSWQLLFLVLFRVHRIFDDTARILSSEAEDCEADWELSMIAWSLLRLRKHLLNILALQVVNWAAVVIGTVWSWGLGR